MFPSVAIVAPAALTRSSPKVAIMHVTIAKIPMKKKKNPRTFVITSGGTTRSLTRIGSTAWGKIRRLISAPLCLMRSRNRTCFHTSTGGTGATAVEHKCHQNELGEGGPLLKVSSPIASSRDDRHDLKRSIA